MTDQLNLDLGMAALELVRAAMDGPTDEYQLKFAELLTSTSYREIGLLAGLVELSTSLIRTLADVSDEPVESILAMIEEDTEERWG